MYTLRGRDLTNFRDGSEAAAAAKSELSLGRGSDFGTEAGCQIAERPTQGAALALGDSMGGLASASASPGSLLASPGATPAGKAASLPATMHPSEKHMYNNRPENETLLQAKAAYCSSWGKRSGCTSRQCHPRRSSFRCRASSARASRACEDLPAAMLPPAQESWAQDELDMVSARESKLASGFTVGSPDFTIEALRNQNQELSERLQKKSQELVKAHDKLHRYEKERSRLIKSQTDTSYYGKCTAPCCLPVTRLEKAGLNAEPLSCLDATWAGYVFSLASVQVRSSGSTFTEIFRKHRNSAGRFDEAAFRDFIHQYFPNIYEDRLTRLFFFADADGSGVLSFLEFLRIFGCDLNGKMGEEYFEHVMVRVHRAIGKRGGMSSVLQLKDRNVQVDGSLNRQRMIDLLLELNIGLNRREAIDLTATFDPHGIGEVQIVEFTDAMNMCASACFVTEEWVHKLFDQVVTMIHTQSRSLHKALMPFASKGSMSREDLFGFLQQFVPGVRDSQAERVFTFLVSGNENSASHNKDEIDLGHFFEVVCRPSLGPTVKGKSDTAFPMEVTERLALQLDRLCGSLSTAFDMLNPCIFIEEFRASLQSLGFAPGMDFTQVFNLLDVHRNGRVQRTTFIQVLQRHVKRLQGIKDSTQSIQTKEVTEIEENAAKKLGRFWRKHLTKKETDGTGMSKFFENRLHKQHGMIPIRLIGGAQMVPFSQHKEVLRDQQRAINRILVLESELEYARRRMAQGMSGHQDRANWTDLRSLESANHRLATRLREVRHKTRAMFASRSPDFSQADMARSASAPPVIQKSLHSSCFVDREDEEKERNKTLSLLKEVQEENTSLHAEKVALQEELASSRHRENSSIKEKTGEDATAQDTESLYRQTSSQSATSSKAPPPRSEAESLTEKDKKLLDMARAVPEKLQELYESARDPEPSTNQRRKITRQATFDCASSHKQKSQEAMGEPPEEPLSPDEDPKRRLSAMRWQMLRNVSTRQIEPEPQTSEEWGKLPTNRRKSALQRPKENSTRKILNALADYIKSNNDVASVQLLMRTIIGLDINNRFTIRDVITVESDSVVLRCTDGYLRREVAVKLPSVDDLANRQRFLRECVIYSHLLDVTEVQDVYHFPGLCEDMVCCVMELLRGQLLSDHLQAIRKNEKEPLTVYEAAEICDAMLYGISECHTRGVVHLDLKPSVVWQVKQPAKVVVKILDFGLAHLANRSLLTADARLLFERRRTSDEDTPNLMVDASADGHVSRVPRVMENAETWVAFAPYAILNNWGTPWYLSPARLCSYVLRHQKSGVSAPDLRWCTASAGENLLIQRGSGDDIDSAHVASINELERCAQATTTVPQLPGGSYFEILIRKVWPRHMIQTASDRNKNWPGMALGFTLTPTPTHGQKLPTFARDIPMSWILGYGGHFYINGKEQKIVDCACPDAITGFRRRQTSNLTGGQEPFLSDVMSGMDGPLGWSFGELYRGDRLGLMATNDGHLEVYVNSHLISKLRVPTLEGQMLLYPVVDLCGRFREVGLVPQPRSPAGDYRSDLFVQHRQQVERLGRRTTMPSNDVFAAGLIAQECFSSEVEPEVPLSFIHLLKAIKQWHKHDRPMMQESGDVLKALCQWIKENRRCYRVPQDILDILTRVFNGGPGDEVIDTDPNSDVIQHASQFRTALNEATSWCHMSPEFLRSHVQNDGFEKAGGPNTARQNARIGEIILAAARQAKTGAPQQNEDVVWDLTPWTLSSSHVRRVVQVLNSADGDHIGMVRIHRVEPNVPVELISKLVDCFRSFQDEDSSDDSDCDSEMTDVVLTYGGSRTTPGKVESARVRTGKLSGDPKAALKQRNNRQLLFAGVPFPSILCPVPFAQLAEANAAGVVLHFVREFDLLHGPAWQGASAGSAQLPVGPEGASVIATALHNNGVLQTLGACGQGFGDVGTSVLVAALQNGCSLRKLDLSSNKIGEQGSAALSIALCHPGCTLQSLNLSHNDIGNSGCHHLAKMLTENESLIYLNLQRNQIGDDGALSLGDALHSNIALQELDLGRNSIGVEGSGKLARVTRSNTSLQSLNLQDNALDALVAAALAEALSSKAPETKKIMKSPQTAQRSQIHDLGSSVRASLPAVPYGSTLRRLNLRHNALGSAGGAELLRALRYNSRLAVLNLAWNDLAGDAAKAFAGLFGAGSLSTLEDVDLRDNLLGEGAAIGLAFVSLTQELEQSSIERLDQDSTRSRSARNSEHRVSVVKRHSSFSRAGTGLIEASKRVSKSHLRGASRHSVRRDETARISTTMDAQRFQGLQDLKKHGWARTPVAAGAYMRKLNLANCRLDMRGIGLLAKAMPIFENLEILYLYNNIGSGARETATALTHQKSESNPSGSDRAGSSVSSAVTSFTEFANSLPSMLRVLSLGSCALGTKLGVAALSKLGGRVALQELDLSDNDLRENDSLVDAVRHFLKSTPSIKKLGLALNALGNSTASTAARVLAATSQEIIVDLAANNVSSEFRDAILRTEQTRSSSKESADAAKTTIEKSADALAMELRTASFPIRGRLRL